MVAIWCGLNGYFEKPAAFWRESPDSDFEGIDENVKFRRNQIPEYQLPWLEEWYFAWGEREAHNRYPFAGGWAEQPAQVIDMFRVFDYVEDLKMKRDKRRQAAASSARSM